MENGTDLRNWRKENHLTQAQLAKMLGYSVSRISHIESCNADLSGKLLKQVTALDKKMNPPVRTDSISLKLQNMKNSAINFHKELSVVEKSIAELLDISVAKDDAREAYLKFLSTAFNEIKCLADVTYTDDVQFKQDTTQHLGIIRKEAYLYAKKKSGK